MENVFWMGLSYIVYLSTWEIAPVQLFHFFYFEKEKVLSFQRNWSFLANLMNIFKYIHICK